MIEGVTVSRRRRRIALAKAWKVGRYQVVTDREQGNQRIELARRRWKSVQTDDRRSVLWAGFTIEDADSIHHFAMIGGCVRGGRQWLRECRVNSEEGSGCGYESFHFCSSPSQSEVAQRRVIVGAPAKRPME